jgi:hypothetical protein
LDPRGAREEWAQPPQERAIHRARSQDDLTERVGESPAVLLAIGDHPMEMGRHEEGVRGAAAMQQVEKVTSARAYPGKHDPGACEQGAKRAVQLVGHHD